ncbi:hypothetical protein GGI35DRAFT_476057 [Trichoderma velutinum]
MASRRTRRTRRQRQASGPAIQAPLAPSVTALPKRDLPELDILLDTPAPQESPCRGSQYAKPPHANDGFSIFDEDDEVYNTAESRPQALGPPTGRRASVRVSGRTRVEIDDDNELITASDDLEEESLDTSDDEGPVSKYNVKVPFVDKDGITQIGPQPKEPAVYVGWIDAYDAPGLD